MIKDEDFKVARVHGNDSVRYFFYIDKEDYPSNRITFPEVINDKKPIHALDVKSMENYTKLGFIPNNNTACFASLPRQLGLAKGFNNPSAKDCTRVIYYPNIHHSITDDSLTHWLTLAKKNDLLPKYCNIKDIVTNKAIVLDVTAHNLDMLFIYLCMVRFLAADPSYVLSVLKLTSKYKVSFLVALLFFTYVNASSLLHHFLPVSSVYIKPKAISHFTNIDLGIVIGLRKFIQKSSTFKKGDVQSDTGTFKTGVAITKLSESLRIDATKLKSSYIPKIVKLANFEKSKELHKKLKKV